MALLGAHVSIQGGVSESISRGEALGCEAIQIFTRNQRQWEAPPLKREQAESFRKRFRDSDIQCVVSHGSYLMNLASPEAEQLERSYSVLLDEIDRAEQLGISYFVFHPGSHKGAGEAAGIDILSECLIRALGETKSSQLMLLIENTAGAANTLGGRFEQLQEVLERVNQPDRLGVCFDTAHAFGAGYELSAPKKIERTFAKLDSMIGHETIHVFHLNDSKVAWASHKDRHEHIGDGKIGIDVFKTLVNSKSFQERPMILETPGDADDYRKNLELLKQLRKS